MQVEDFNSIDFNIFPFEPPTIETLNPAMTSEQDLYNILLEEIPEIPTMELQEQLSFLTPTGMEGMTEQPVHSEEENFSYSSSPSSTSSPTLAPSSPSDEELLNQLLNGDPTLLNQVINPEGINPFVLIKQESELDKSDLPNNNTNNDKQARKRRRTNNGSTASNNSTPVSSSSSSPAITGQKRSHDDAFVSLLDEPNPEVVVNMTTAELKQLKNHFTPEQVKEIKKQRRMLKNRLSAHESRMRKKNHIDELEARIAEINKDREELRQKVNSLTLENQQLKEEVQILRKESEENSVIQSVLNGVQNLTTATTPPAEPPTEAPEKQRIYHSRPSSPSGNIKTMGVCLAVVLFSFGMFFNSHPDFTNSRGPSIPFENMIFNEPSAALKYPEVTQAKTYSVPMESRQRVGGKVILSKDDVAKESTINTREVNSPTKTSVFMAEAYEVCLPNYGARGVNKTSLVLVPLIQNCLGNTNYHRFTNSSIIVGPPSPL